MRRAKEVDDRAEEGQEHQAEGPGSTKGPFGIHRSRRDVIREAFLPADSFILGNLIQSIQLFQDSRDRHPQGRQRRVEPGNGPIKAVISWIG